MKTLSDILYTPIYPDSPLTFAHELRTILDNWGLSEVQWAEQGHGSVEAMRKLEQWRINALNEIENLAMAEHGDKTLTDVLKEYRAKSQEK